MKLSLSVRLAKLESKLNHLPDSRKESTLELLLMKLLQDIQTEQFDLDIKSENLQYLNDIQRFKYAIKSLGLIKELFQLLEQKSAEIQ